MRAAAILVAWVFLLGGARSQTSQNIKGKLQPVAVSVRSLLHAPVIPVNTKAVLTQIAGRRRLLLQLQVFSCRRPLFRCVGSALLFAFRPTADLYLMWQCSFGLYGG